MQIPILNGIFSDGEANLRTSYPRNMVPVPKSNGISQGYLRPASGIEHFSDTPGLSRGAVLWRGVHYRVLGDYLCSISDAGSVSQLAYIGGGTGNVTFDYSFDLLGIAAGGVLHYWNGSELSTLTDTDAGIVIDFVWVDGYFMITNGDTLAVTELNNPLEVNPLKYGSSEADPDPVVALLKLRNEVYALNRHTIEVFENFGGELFPFSRIEGAQIQRGTLGVRTCAVFMESIAFMGGGRDEAIAVWFGSNSNTAKISTREIDQILGEYTAQQLALSLMEARVFDGHQMLYIHLPDRTLVYDGASSQVLGEPAWHILTSGNFALGQYRARDFLLANGAWTCGDTLEPQIGTLTYEVGSQYGDKTTWDFGTQIVYNESRGAVFHQLELVCLTGRVGAQAAPVVTTSYSTDGQTWSLPRACNAGAIGNRAQRVQWLQMGFMRNFRIQRFSGDSDAHISVIRLEARLEPMNA